MQNILDFLVIGAGAAGVRFSYLLHQKNEKEHLGLKNQLIEKSRGAGGRLATRRVQVENQLLQVELGALTMHQPWRSSAARQEIEMIDWHGFQVFKGQSNLFLKQMLESMPANALQTQSRLHTLDYDEASGAWRARCVQEQVSGSTEISYQARHVVLAVPAPQALHVLISSQCTGQFPLPALVKATMACRWVWIVVAKGDVPSEAMYFPAGDDMIESVAVVSQRPDRQKNDDLQCFHIALTLDWSLQHHNADKLIIQARDNSQLLKRLKKLVGAQCVQTVITAQAHKWLYAHPEHPLSENYLVNDRADLWCIGDWASGYGLDDAFFSAESAFQAVQTKLYPSAHTTIE